MIAEGEALASVFSYTCHIHVWVLAEGMNLPGLQFLLPCRDALPQDLSCRESTGLLVEGPLM